MNQDTIRPRLCITASVENCFPKALVVFKGLDLAIETAAKLGYGGLELALFDKANVDIPSLKRKLAAAALQVPVISTGQLFTMKNVWFTHPDEAVRKQAVNECCELVEVAAELGADLNISRVRGSIDDGDTHAEGLEKLTECLVPVCAKAEAYGLKVVLEQMNRYETNYFNDVASIGEYIRRLALSNLTIHADTFHMNIEDADMTGVLREYGKELGYIHFADSNRLAPGAGHIDFKGILNTLESIGYTGWIGIEALPVPNPYEAARASIEFLRPLLPR